MTANFMVVHGNRPEALRDLLLAWTGAHPLAPLENEVVLVQSNGVAQWLKLAFARDREAGGHGIAAAIDAQLPARFLWQAYRTVLGESAVPASSPFDKSLLVWRLMRLLPRLIEQPVYAPLLRFLERDVELRKRFQLSERLADLFDQYQVYRADWLDEWAAGGDRLFTSRQGWVELSADVAWQPPLWRALLTDVGAELADSSRAAVHRRFLAALAGSRDQHDGGQIDLFGAGELPAPQESGAAQRSRRGRRAGAGLPAPAVSHPVGLPKRLLVFGISSMPQQALEALAALSAWTQVLMCVHNPCEHYWADIVADKDLLAATRSRQQRRQGTPADLDEEQLHWHAHPLLAAWGKQGRDFIGLLDRHDRRESYEQRFTQIQQRIDLFESGGDDTLLRQLQDDIRDLRPLAESRQRWPAVDPRTDRSIRFHVTHSALREVEVLHDQLLDALARDPTLTPRDVIVMVPDVDVSAPLIASVFGLHEPGDPRHIPFTIADRGQRGHDPLLSALDQLLSLSNARLAVGDVLDLLEVPALRRRFGIDEDQMPMLHRWVTAANVRWGLHAGHRQSLDLPGAPEQNSWAFGLRRLLLGYAVGAGSAWQGQDERIEPLDEIGGLDASLLGPLVKLIDSLESTWRELGSAASPFQWGEQLRRLLDTFFLADDRRDGYTLLRLDEALRDWQEACGLAEMTEPLPLSVVREAWLGGFDATTLGRPFIAGGVTFATLMPMRAIPFRLVCLLGMNDGDYPRMRVAMDFDLMSRDYRPGDRSRREDDRYLFLEALLSARDHLHVSWVGHDIHDNSERPPSVLVAQLRDHLVSGWRIAGTADTAQQSPAGGKALLRALTVEHPLQPFSRRYFTGDGRDGLFSYSREWRDGLAPHAAALGPASLAPLPTYVWSQPLSIKEVADFLAKPVRAFFKTRLKASFDDWSVDVEDTEPFRFDALQAWKLQDELIAAQRRAVDAGADRAQALAAAWQRITDRGDLPIGGFSSAVRRAADQPMDSLFDRYARVLQSWPTRLDDQQIDFEVAVDGQVLVLADWLAELRRDAHGQRGRLVLSSGGVVDKTQHYRFNKVIPFWIHHVAGHLSGEPLTSVIISKAGSVELKPLDIEWARHYWRTLLTLGLAPGMAQPLPLAVETGFEWLAKGGRAGMSADSPAGRAARAFFEGGGFNVNGERTQSPYLVRVFANFDELFANGEFARLVSVLLRPMVEQVGKATGGRAS